MLASYFENLNGEAGIDEAGRGCLAGPVVAAAVMLPFGFELPGLDDSKKLKPAKRECLAALIKEQALAWAIAEASVEEIGSLNILHASLLAMRRAVQGLNQKPALLLIDGNRFKQMEGYAHSCQVKGDVRFASIAAASILAKTHRDALMKTLAKTHPHYGLERHFGYPTLAHREAIALHGPCHLHRKGFRLLKVKSEI